MSTVDNKQARVAALIEKGKKNGSLTQKEIQEALADLQVSPEAYENILDRFEEMGIDVTGDAQEPPEEELAMWAIVSPNNMLIQPAQERYMDLFTRVFGITREQLTKGPLPDVKLEVQ